MWDMFKVRISSQFLRLKKTKLKKEYPRKWYAFFLRSGNEYHHVYHILLGQTTGEPLESTALRVIGQIPGEGLLPLRCTHTLLTRYSALWEQSQRFFFVSVCKCATNIQLELLIYMAIYNKSATMAIGDDVVFMKQQNVQFSLYTIEIGRCNWA